VAAARFGAGVIGHAPQPLPDRIADVCPRRRFGLGLPTFALAGASGSDYPLPACRSPARRPTIAGRFHARTAVTLYNAFDNEEPVDKRR
jgi:hypothetical protein